MTKNNNKPKSRNCSILYEPWMSANDFLIRRDFYGGTARPYVKSLSVGETFSIEVPTESYNRQTDALMGADKFQNWETYTSCSKELFEYSEKGLESIKI